MGAGLPATGVHSPLLASPEHGGFFAQGWSMSLGAGATPLARVEGGLAVAEAEVAVFDRADILPPIVFGRRLHALLEAGARIAGVAVIVDRGAGPAIVERGLHYRAAYSLADLDLA